LIFHSDRGSQYASQDFRDVLGEYGITASMSRRKNREGASHPSCRLRVAESPRGIENSFCRQELRWRCEAARFMSQG